MSENVLKQQRATAAAVLVEKIREVKRYMSLHNVSIRLLEQKLDKIIQAKDDLCKKHYAFADKIGEQLDSEELIEWITPRLDEAIDVADEAFITIEQLEFKEKEDRTREETALAKNGLLDKKRNEHVITQMQSETTEEILKNRILKLAEIINDEARISTEDGDIVEAYMKEIEVFMDDLTKSWNKLKVLSTDSDKLKEIFTKENEIRILVSQKRLAAYTFIKRVNPTSNSVTVKREEIASNGNDPSVQIQKMKPPSFSGNIRTFARFRADFKMIIESKYFNKDHQAYILKENCLHGEAKRIVENIDDVNKIWERLENKYGDNIEIVNTILKEIENLTFMKYNQDQSLVNLVDTLERGIQDLEIIGAKDEITNAYTVKLLETKLPRRVLAKWLEREVGCVGKDRFEKLFEFLKQERKQTERMMQLDGPKEPVKNMSLKDQKKLHFNAALYNNTSNKEKQKFNNNCLIHPNSSHLTRKCRSFLQKTVEERGKIVKDSNGCKLCLSVSHVGETCPFESSWGTCKVNGCNEYHSHLVHGCSIQGISMHVQNTSVNQKDPTIRGNALLLVQKVKALKGEILTFWDNGSTIALVAKSFVKRMNLTGIPVSYDLVTVGGVVKNQKTILHEITIIDRAGKNHLIKAYEIEDICGKMKSVEIEGIQHLFPFTKHRDIARCAGNIELLIGMEYANIHPKSICEREGIVLYKSAFGTGKIIGGSHNKINDGDKISSFAQVTAHAQVHNVRVNKRVYPGIDFFSAEDFGIRIPPRCHRCKDCKECRFETHQLSKIEQKELDVIRDNLQLDPIKNHWTTTYPYKRDPSILEDNKNQALIMLQKTEKRLSRSKISAERYNEQFNDLIERGIFSEITEEEEVSYNGPKFYISHHEIFKEGSSSTPMRLVINSSLKYNGISLNDILMKGPNSLNDLFGIQLRFRKYQYALVGDIQKMYHSIHTTQQEKHLRRILWRGMKTDESPKVYGINRVMFGDRPAAAISSVAIHKTAEIYKHTDEMIAQMIQNDMYVDDLTTGGDSREDVERYKRNISDILGRGGFIMKGFVTSFDKSAEALALLGTGEIGRILGICWDPAKDEFAVVAKINLSKKYKGAHTEPDYKVEEIPRLIDVKLTRRILLSIANSCYDPLGLLSPITIQLKIELRNLYNKELSLGWDDPIPVNMKVTWVKLIQLLKNTEKVRGKSRSDIILRCITGSYVHCCLCTVEIK